MGNEQGFSLIEAMFGALLLFIAAAMVMPTYAQNLILSGDLWQRRAAMKVIESELDWSCNYTQTDFDGLPGESSLGTTLPAELGDLAELNRTAECVNWDNPSSSFVPVTCTASEHLMRVDVRVNWTSHGRALQQPEVGQPPITYLISRTGTCASAA